jgi:hypothetical protein
VDCCAVCQGRFWIAERCLPEIRLRGASPPGLLELDASAVGGEGQAVENKLAEGMVGFGWIRLRALRQRLGNKFVPHFWSAMENIGGGA